MDSNRKLMMCCKHPTPCDACLDDCKRAEITAKENRVRADLLAACKLFIIAINVKEDLELPLSVALAMRDTLVAAEKAIAKAEELK